MPNPSLRKLIRTGKKRLEFGAAKNTRSSGTRPKSPFSEEGREALEKAGDMFKICWELLAGRDER